MTNDRNTSMSLSAESAQQIEELCNQGYQLYDQQSYEAALRVFYQAWLILPKPQSQYQQAAWVLTAIGDSYYKIGNFKQSIEALNSALHCPGGQLAFIHTRLAQAYYETADKNSAAEALSKSRRIRPKTNSKTGAKIPSFHQKHPPKTLVRRIPVRFDAEITFLTSQYYRSSIAA